ncbi:VOC family protein [Bacillus sp. IBL03825]|uniref:VOC family protein n=1 Tax=Bacillus sp. IBL03825 TaxID=2953580 RepID=UPI00215893AB|nr:VOC family protein [Bacillus sp. IBL03825]MCR6850454.1 VOC family protein [Bacillus sp. IBL03825]
MVNVFKLGYVNFFVKDLEAMKSYYTNIMGFSLTEQLGDGSIYFSSSTDHHNIILTPSNKSEINQVGLQLKESISIKEAAAQLNKLGISTKFKTDAQPGIKEQLEFMDLDGYVVQLYSRMNVAAPGFREVGITPNKLGHLSLYVKNAKKSVDFYKNLGLKNTDWIEDYFGFMTCNTDHHVLNFCTSEKHGIHHIAFELRDYTHLNRSLDFLGKKGIPIQWGPSRHGAGHNLATYHYDPDHNMIELFTDLDVYIEDLNYFEPRPWHEDYPQRPKVWSTEECITKWGTTFEKSLV